MNSNGRVSGRGLWMCVSGCVDDAGGGGGPMNALFNSGINNRHDL